MLASWSHWIGWKWQRWRRHWKDFRARREHRASSWWTQKTFPSRAMDNPITTQFANLMHNFTLKAGAPCMKLTPGMTSPSFKFAPRKMKFWLHQIKTVSWLWFRIQLNKPLSWLPASFLNVIAPKSDNINHVNQLAGGNLLRAYLDWSSAQSHQSHPSAGQSLLNSWEDLLSSPPDFGARALSSPHTCFLPSDLQFTLSPLEKSVFL